MRGGDKDINGFKVIGVSVLVTMKQENMKQEDLVLPVYTLSFFNRIRSKVKPKLG